MKFFRKNKHLFKNLSKRALHIILFGMGLLLVFSAAGQTFASNSAQADDPESKALALLERMRPEEKVGQLFLVSFTGNQALPESRIYDLISEYHIGGVVLEREQNNFVGAPSTIDTLSSLIRGIQEAEGASAQFSRFDPLTGDDYFARYIPVFVAMSQDGDGFPNDQILEGLSAQANAMTIGASWDPERARSSGILLGSELAELGINLLLGPSLDILDDPSPEKSDSIGVRSFGGSPYWVSLMAQAFIEGIHIGSSNQVGVVSKHLPGFGSSDRPLGEEIPTLRKSLDELIQFELEPFFLVTGDAPSSEARTDALLLSHIHYQGFQGNIPGAIRPISFDPQAINDLMALEPLASWRDTGGLLISDSLGTRAIRRNYDPNEQNFNGPAIALDAFLAGNDMLYLGDFSANEDGDSFSTIADTALFFTQKYREDAAFAERVDEAVLRVLTLKYKLYPIFNTFSVYPDLIMPEGFGQNSDLIFEIGLEAATLLSPSIDQLAETMPSGPRIDEQIVFIVDSYLISQCDVCDPYPIVDPGDFEKAVENLYGPSAGNRISNGNVTSFSFHELNAGLDDLENPENVLMSNLQSADWIVFGILDKSDQRSDSLALQRLMAEQPELLLEKNVLVFSLNAAYILDATEVAKLTAYYGLYGKNEQMADIAARLLFQEITAPGASPVSIDGIGYSLDEATSPDPQRLIPIEAIRMVLAPEEGDAVETPEFVGTIDELQITIFEAGDRIELIAGPILDNNGNPVPDNTQVQFSIALSNEDNSLLRSIEAVTRSSMALANYSIESEGSLQISASAGNPPASSEILEFDVIGINAEALALQVALLTGTPSIEENSEQEAEGGASSEVILDPRLSVADWFLSVLVSSVAALVAFQIGSSLSTGRWAVLSGFLTVIGGLITTIYLAFYLPGTEFVLETWGIWGIAFITFITAMLGWISAWLWTRRRKAR